MRFILKLTLGLFALACQNMLAGTGSATAIHPLTQWIPTEHYVLTNSLPAGNENWGLESCGFIYSITLEKTEYQMNEPIILNLVLKNTSSELQMADWLGIGMSRLDLQITIMDSNGERVWINPNAEAQQHGGRGSGHSQRCKAGTAMIETIRIDPIFMLKPNHSYYVYATKSVADQNTWKRIPAISGNAFFSILSSPNDSTNETLLALAALEANPPPPSKKYGITAPHPILAGARGGSKPLSAKGVEARKALFGSSEHQSLPVSNPQALSSATMAAKTESPTLQNSRLIFVLALAAGALVIVFRAYTRAAKSR